MAGGREIKTKIKSVQNTRKVTRALEMVSASKIRKAQERMRSSRPYARLMKQLIGHIGQQDLRRPLVISQPLKDPGGNPMRVSTAAQRPTAV